MFRKVLYPTDFSEVATRALEYIKQLKPAGAQEVVILHILDRKELRNLALLGGVTGNYPIDLNTEFKRLENEHLENVRNIVNELKTAGFSAKGIVREGNPLAEILKTAEDEAVSVIVIGSTGKSNLQETILGSVSEGVIKRSCQPVLIIKRDTRQGGHV
ncbi:universal stress protein [Dehalogenimonas alkenigignens]|uniref:Universal stress protein UspA or related nucleotide-binding protein n=1 Tax=Dehalogenimonas alkenigignens TaxID=1217799 RepID=A0A0W0GHK5_9CHLR|nr:universal stress protein [Dehalogenimonas alkenigignens]KTB48040.1 Universal stress protein UspA or related nucleotide-binding protein [Dehalogenimonas alkenigignens]PVV84294.1 universal stress protein [Dehalogenimonas alkenigignens]